MNQIFRCVAAIFRQRCPKCWRGRVFTGAVAMNERCPVCGHKFQQDGGYFLGAMYMSYGLSFPVLALLTMLIRWLFLPSWNLEYVVLVALVPYLLFVPAIFRYSRILWMFFDLA